MDGESAKFWVFSYLILWCFYLIYHIVLIVPTAHTFLMNDDNIITTSYSWIEITGMAECIVILIHFLVHEQRMKVCFSKYVEFYTTNIFNAL